jgi:hypothetical protein
MFWKKYGRGRETTRLNGGRSRIRIFGTFCPFEKDSLTRASEKCGLNTDLFGYAEKLVYFHERAIAALRPAKAAFLGTGSAERDT